MTPKRSFLSSHLSNLDEAGSPKLSRRNIHGTAWSAELRRPSRRKDRMQADPERRAPRRWSWRPPRRDEAMGPGIAGWRNEGPPPAVTSRRGARRPVSRVLCRLLSQTRRSFLWTGRHRPVLATHPDRSGRRRPCPAPPRRRRAHGPYSVLLQAGLAMRSASPPTRCALTAPFHPYPRPERVRAPGGLLSVALSLGSLPAGVARRLVAVEPGLSSPPEKGDRPAVWPGAEGGAFPALGQRPACNCSPDLRGGRSARPPDLRPGVGARGGPLTTAPPPRRPRPAAAARPAARASRRRRSRPRARDASGAGRR